MATAFLLTFYAFGLSFGALAGVAWSSLPTSKIAPKALRIQRIAILVLGAVTFCLLIGWADIMTKFDAATLSDWYIAAILIPIALGAYISFRLMRRWVYTLV